MTGETARSDDVSSLPEVRIMPSGPLSGELDAPSSKSITNRLFLMASLAAGTSRLTDPLDSDDTAVMSAALGALGARFERPLASSIEITGTAGAPKEPIGTLWAGLSGTTLRFLLGLSTLVNGTVTLDGEEALRRRPLGGLIEAMSGLGARVESASGRPPVTVTAAGLEGGSLVLDAGSSSQFATSMLLVAPYARRDVELTVTRLGAHGYVDLTIEAMNRWGAVAERAAANRFHVAAGRPYRASSERVAYDASAAAHLFALGLATGGSVTVANASPSLQPDAAIVEVLAAMGARVSAGSHGVTVAGGEHLVGTDVDLSTMPDQLPTIAVLGALAHGVTRLTNVAVARGHETDRVDAVATELARLGVRVEATSDTLTVRGTKFLHGGLVETYDDHRMAMAFAALGAVVEGVRIRAPGCVAKTFPGFWQASQQLGLRLQA